MSKEMKLGLVSALSVAVLAVSQRDSSTQVKLHELRKPI